MDSNTDLGRGDVESQHSSIDDDSFNNQDRVMESLESIASEVSTPAGDALVSTVADVAEDLESSEADTDNPESDVITSVVAPVRKVPGVNMDTVDAVDLLPKVLKDIATSAAPDDSDKFSGMKLFDYQQMVFEYMTNPNVLDGNESPRGILLYHAVGSGKCMGLGTPVLMSDGTIKKIESVRVGDRLAGCSRHYAKQPGGSGDAAGNSTARTVLSIATGVDKMYNIWYGKYKYTVNSEHILCLKADFDAFPMSYELPNTGHSQCGHRVVFVHPRDSKLYFKDFDLSEDDPRKPLAHTHSLRKQAMQSLIAWARANSGGSPIVEISVNDYLDLPFRIKNVLKGFRLPCVNWEDNTTTVNTVDAYSSQDNWGEQLVVPKNNAREYYDRYTRGALFDRWWFITSLLETYGKMYGGSTPTQHSPRSSSYGDNESYQETPASPSHPWKAQYSLSGQSLVSGMYVDFSLDEKPIVDALVFACQSSGILSSCCKRKSSSGVMAYRVKVFGREMVNLPWSDSDNAMTFSHHMFNTWNKSFYDGYRIKVKYAYTGDYYGFTLDGDGRYLLGDCTVTHNTMTSISIAEMFRKAGRRCIVLSAKSLQLNYQKEIDTFERLNGSTVAEDGGALRDKYEFITSNSRTLVDKLQAAPSAKGRKKETAGSTSAMDMQVLQDVMAQHSTLEGSVLIVDEAHNLFNSIANGSETASKFYDLVMDTKDIKLIFMSGTPIVNDPFEIAVCFNMLKGKQRVGRKEMTIMPEHYTDFAKYFVTQTPGNDKSGMTTFAEQKFKARIFGLVSYYGPLYKQMNPTVLSQDLKKTIKLENYPDRLPVIFEVVQMSPPQCSAYMMARDKERLENKGSKQGGSIYKEKSNSSTSYRIRSRVLSNIYAEGKTLEEKSPKALKLVNNIQSAKVEGIHVIYSTFLESGLHVVAEYLRLIGFKPWEAEPKSTVKEGDDAPTYAMFSGEQTLEEKQAVLQAVTSPENIQGEKIKVLLISKSGTEGLDLKNVRYVHIFEPYWNFSLIQQIIARGVRYKSHILLPEDQRTTQTIIYLSDYNTSTLKEFKDKLAQKAGTSKHSGWKSSKLATVEKTTDIHMLHNAIARQELIDTFLRAMAEASVECAALVDPNNKALKCFSCKATGHKLYSSMDIHEDMMTKPTCEQSTSTMAEKILVNGEELFIVSPANAGDSQSNLGGIYRRVQAATGDRFIKISAEEEEWIRTNLNI
jgi:superfamily II DNA or RNA helicase